MGSGLATMRGDDVWFPFSPTFFVFCLCPPFVLFWTFWFGLTRPQKKTFLHSSLDSRVPFFGLIFHGVIVFFASLRISTLERR